MKRKPSPNGNHTAVVEHYARLAPKYDKRWDRYTQRTLSTLIDRIDLTAGIEAERHEGSNKSCLMPPCLHACSPRILDVACGTGRLQQMLLELDPDVHVTGVDISPEMVEIAKHRLPERDFPNVKWLVSPAESLPVEDESFDVVTCANAFHLVADPLKTLAEFRRVLKPGGRLVIIDWCREYPTITMLLFVSRLFGKQYRRLDTVRGLLRTLTSAEFNVVHAEKFKATWFWGMMCVVAEKESGDRS